MLEKLVSKIEQYNPRADLSLIIDAYHLPNQPMKAKREILVRIFHPSS